MNRWLVIGAVLVAGVLGTGCGPLPDYSHCFSNDDCVSGVCAEIHAPTTTGGVIIGRMCTRPCGSSSECRARSGYAGGCLMISADSTPGSFYCYQGCSTDFDCPTGVCTPITGGASGAVCFPDH